MYCFDILYSNFCNLLQYLLQTYYAIPTYGAAKFRKIDRHIITAFEKWQSPFSVLKKGCDRKQARPRREGEGAGGTMTTEPMPFRPVGSLGGEHEERPTPSVTILG